MKRIFVMGCISFLIQSSTAAPQRLTTDDPNFQSLSQLSTSIGWYQVSDTRAWSVGDADANRDGAVCMVTLDKLRAAGVPDTRSLDIHWESPELKPGVHTLAEIRKSCEHVARIGKIKEFEKWGILAMQSGTNYRSGADFYRMCLKSYDDAIKAGTSPTERVADRTIGGVQWTGSIEDLRKKWCEAGASMASSQTSEKEAPFRKALKADKLKIALTYGSVFLPGKLGTANPQKMAAASVWFLDLSPPQNCPNGSQVHTVRRYQFDGDQLVKTTHHDYCGAAPTSAFQ